MRQAAAASRRFDGERYDFVANFSTLAQASRNAKTQRYVGGKKARVVRWERSRDGATLFAVYARRRKDYWRKPQ